MAKYEKTITGHFDDVVKKLENDISNSGISMKLVDESNYSIGNNSDIFISAIGAGGGQGVFLNFSLGAEGEMVRIVEQSLEQM